MSKKRLGKQFLTWLLAATMVLTLLPVSMLAADGEARFYGKNVTSTYARDNTSVSAAAVQNTDTEGEDQEEPKGEPEESQHVAQIVETKIEYETIAEAIADAKDGQTVKLLKDVKESITISKSLTLDLDGFTLSGADEQNAVVTITDSDEEKPVITIKSSKLEEEKPVNGTITGGKHENNDRNNTGSGGGLAIANATVTLENLAVTGNEAEDKGSGELGGGGIYAVYANVSMKNVIVSQNTVSQSGNDGGGILVKGSTLEMENCIVNNNKADDCGGGLCVEHSDLSISSSIIKDNSARNGAGIYFCDSDQFGHKEANCPGEHKHSITGTQIFNNQASSSGGGMYIGTTSKIFISDCSITKNRAYSGGGISSFSAKDVTFDKVSITENEATDGGGLYINATPACNTDVKLQNGTEIKENRATKEGGGIHAKAMFTAQLSVAVKNSSISDNTATKGAGIATKNAKDQATINVKLESGAAVQNNTATTYGGGIYVPNKANVHVAGTVTTDDGVSEGAALYNNTAENAGDDLWMNDATFTLPAAAAMSGDRKLTDDGKEITGWFYDGIKNEETTLRWNAAMEDGSKYYDKYTPAENDTQAIALKAAHGLMCTVTYTDGVENKEIFADKVCAVEQGSPTPAFDGNPTRSGYTFMGWSPAVTETVTADVTYTAQWKRIYRPTPSTPTVEIPDEDALGLNTDDHFAYIIGYPDGTVQPNGQITRAEATTIFFRLLTDESREANLTRTNRYTDVAAGAWYNTAISTMTRAGIVDGYPDGTFRPDAPITRAEMSKIISLFAELDKKTDRFSDIAGHWAEKYIKLAAGNGWIEGYPDGTFGPQRNITRAETATMINRVLERVPSQESRLLDRAAMQTWPDANPGDWFYLAIQEATNSHDYERNAKWAAADEQWTALRETRDWKALEQ